MWMYLVLLTPPALAKHQKPTMKSLKKEELKGQWNPRSSSTALSPSWHSRHDSQLTIWSSKAKMKPPMGSSIISSPPHPLLNMGNPQHTSKGAFSNRYLRGSFWDFLQPRRNKRHFIYPLTLLQRVPPHPRNTSVLRFEDKFQRKKSMGPRMLSGPSAYAVCPLSCNFQSQNSTSKRQKEPLAEPWKSASCFTQEEGKALINSLFWCSAFMTSKEIGIIFVVGISFFFFLPKPASRARHGLGLAITSALL